MVVFAADPYGGRVISRPDGIWSWVTQRISNRLPLWSRARLNEDTILQALINPFAVQCEELYTELIDVRNNYFITTASLNQQGFLYEVQLPMTFAFDYTEHEGGTITFLEPTVLGTVDSSTYTLQLLDPNKSYMIERREILPSRVSASLLCSVFSNEILPATTLAALSSATINDLGLSDFGVVYVKINGGSLFGWRENDDKNVTPKVILTGILDGQRKEIEEHLLFPTNATFRSPSYWKEIEQVDVRGIEDSTTTVELNAGFARDYAHDPFAMLSTSISETPLFYELNNLPVVGGGNIPYIKHNTTEIDSIALQRQGYSTRITEHEVAVLYDHGEYLDDEWVDIEQMPNTRWLVGVSQTGIYFVDNRLPHPLSLVGETGDGDSIYSKALTLRTPNADLNIEVDTHHLLRSKQNGSVNVTTWHRKRQKGIARIRLSIIVDSPTMNRPSTTYLDPSGNLILIGGSWIENVSDTTGPYNWDDISFTIDVDTLAGCSIWAAYLRLDTIYEDSSEETDTTFVFSPYTLVEKSFVMPTELMGHVVGIASSKDQQLCILDDQDRVWQLNFSYDYYLIDYRRNKLWLLENYDSVGIAS